MTDDNIYMKQALAETETAFRQGEIPIGAVVVCRDKIIARSHNLTELLHDVTVHAEMQAITASAVSSCWPVAALCWASAEHLQVFRRGLSGLAPLPAAAEVSPLALI